MHVMLRSTRARSWLGMLLAAVMAIASQAGQCAEVHYAPVENLEQIDVALIGEARVSIDLAAFSLTSWAVIDALVQARERGVAVRIILDRTQKQRWDRLAPLLDVVRLKPGGPYMHLKSYAVDEATLRTGSANFSPSGLKQQDNDLVVLRDAAKVEAFRARYVALWDRGQPPPAP